MSEVDRLDFERRAVLSVLLAGGVSTAGGCVGRGGRDGRAPANATAVINVANVEPFGNGLPVEASVEASQPWVTPERTAAIDVSLINRSGRVYELLAGTGDWRMLSNRASNRVRPGVALLGEDTSSEPTTSAGTDAGPTPDREPENDSPDGRRRTSATDKESMSNGCWKLSDDTANPLQVQQLTRLEPREERSMRFGVWGHYQNPVDLCLPTGEFAFGDSYTGTNPSGRTEFEWGFSLRIEAIE